MLVLYVLTLQSVLLYVALVVAVTGVFLPTPARYIHYFWMKLAEVLAHVTQPVLLGLIFYCLLFPLSLLSKLTRKRDPLLLSDKTKTTFVEVNKQFDKQSFEKTW